MPLFKCKIGLPSGEVEIRQFQAESRETLSSRLRNEGIHLFSAQRKGWDPSAFFASKGKASTSELATFTQELLVLLHSGMPILEILSTLQTGRQQGPLNKALTNIHDDIEGGSSLSVAFEKNPEVFPSLFIAALRAGERSGDIPNTLRRYLTHQKRIETMRRKLRNAAFYPALLTFAGLGVMLFMLFYVLPRFSEIYADAVVELPWITRALIQSSSFIIDATPILMVSGIAVIWGVRRICQVPSMVFYLARKKLRLPLLGPIHLEMALMNFCQTMGTLLGSGFPAVQAMKMSRDTVNNSYLQQQLEEAIHAVTGGERLSEALAKTGFFPPLSLRMIGVGERSGALQEMLEDLASFYEERLDQKMHRISTLFEPLIMVLIGLLIGGIVLAIYLPIFQLGATI